MSQNLFPKNGEIEMTVESTFQTKLDTHCLKIARKGLSVWWTVGEAMTFCLSEKSNKEDRDALKKAYAQICQAAETGQKQCDNYKKVYDRLRSAGVNSEAVALKRFKGLPVTGFLAVFNAVSDESGCNRRAAVALEYLASLEKWELDPAKNWGVWGKACVEFPEMDAPSAYAAFLEAEEKRELEGSFENVKEFKSQLEVLATDLSGAIEKLDKVSLQGENIKKRQTLKRLVKDWQAHTKRLLDLSETEDPEIARANASDLEHHKEAGDKLLADADALIGEQRQNKPSDPQVTAPELDGGAVSQDTYNTALDTIKSLENMVANYQTALQMALLLLDMEDMHTDSEAAIEALRPMIEERHKAEQAA